MWRCENFYFILFYFISNQFPWWIFRSLIVATMNSTFTKIYYWNAPNHHIQHWNNFYRPSQIDVIGQYNITDDSTIEMKNIWGERKNVYIFIEHLLVLWINIHRLLFFFLFTVYSYAYCALAYSHAFFLHKLRRLTFSFTAFIQFCFPSSLLCRESMITFDLQIHIEFWILNGNLTIRLCRVFSLVFNYFKNR